MNYPPVRTALAAFVALLLASSLTHGQQAPTTPAATPVMKTKVKTKRSKTVAATALPAGTPADGAALAPPLPPAGGPRRAGDGPGPGEGPSRPGPGGPGRHQARVQALSEFSGTITDYLALNDDQVYDGFGFKTSTGTETVRFPRHLAQALLAVAKAGSSVTLTGFRNTDPQGRAALHLVSLVAGGQTVRDTPPVRPTRPPAEESATVRGTVQRLAQGPRGETNAVVLNDGTVLRLPPPAAEQLAEKLKVGAAVAATGTLRVPGTGEVAARSVRVVRAQTITLEGVQFLVR